MFSYPEFSFAVSDISDLSETVPLLAWLVWGKKSKPYVTLGLLFLFSAPIKLATLLTAVLSIHNMPAYHVLAYLEVAFLWVYYNQLGGRKVPYAGLLVLLLLYSANIYLQDIQYTFNSNTWTCTVMLILLLGFGHFYDIYKSDITVPLVRQPAFFITSGWLIYAGGSLFSYLMGTDILSGTPDGFFKNAWIFQCFANIIKNGLVAYGLAISGGRCHK